MDFEKFIDFFENIHKKHYNVQHMLVVIPAKAGI